MNKNKIKLKKWEETICIRTLQLTGKWINRLENKIEIY